MKSSHLENTSFCNNMSTNEKSEFDTANSAEIAEEDSNIASSGGKANNKYRPKVRKRSNDVCYTLNFYEKFGNIYISHTENQIFVAKVRKVNFDDNFQELFEKGRSNIGNYFKEDVTTIPDITFWYQRYYYYKRFDEGIKMDYESWWSVTPEELAKYTATLCEGKVVADGFCGSGGNVIQKVYAIDIDEKKLNLCRNNARVYECADNIEFIQSDYLKMLNKIKVDYVFLSPPWGGMKYKDSDVYSIKELMTPNIYDIVRVSLNIAKNIIFYVPRTLLLDELFEILSTILNSNHHGSGDRIFFDVHILKSAKKIKALMIVFGHDIKDITSSDLSDYITLTYQNISPRNLNILTTIAKLQGNYKFLQSEYYFRKQHNLTSNSISRNSLDPSTLIKHFYEIMTEQEKIKFKSLNIVKSGVVHRVNKNSYKKNYSISFPLNIINNLNLSIDQTSSTCLSKLTIQKLKKKKSQKFIAIKEIEVQFLASRERTVNNMNMSSVPITVPSGEVSEQKNKFNNYNQAIKPKRIITKTTKV